MSMNGRMRAEMIARQKEELRKQRVREQCNQMILKLESKLNMYMNNVHYSDIFESDSSVIKDQINATKVVIKSDPDSALSNLNEISTQLNRLISNVVAIENKWSEERKASYQKIEEMIDIFASSTIRSAQYSKERDKLLSKLESLRDTATSSHDIENTLAKVHSEIELIIKMDEQEEIRKETVRKIVSILKEQGFSIKKPILKEDAVHVTGTLPSGKKVLFQIYPEGAIDFDLDGYSGQTCKNEIEGVIEKLNEGDEIESSIEQFAWHNPDKIKKGSKEFPYGSGQTRYMRK
ncbi:hypothetical protein V7O61_07515 [Methanolobus sp. WCC1]|uniref:hypothetical protein n=1 Tax=unclassified Methanolobus TaxID=2629569 RepID=UPI00258C858D|nr:hypothetical protein [Methanolobus sp.]MDK2831234.1 hypothetical protein [Methanolobus sp.]